MYSTLFTTSNKMTPSNQDIYDLMREFDQFFNFYFPKKGKAKKEKLIFDFANEYLVHGTWLDNYFVYEFFRKSNAERRAYMTWKELSEFTIEVNGYYSHAPLRDKSLFNKTFAQFVKRDWLYMENASEEDFIAFCSKHKTYIEKPLLECCGKGICKKEVGDVPLSDLYQKYKGAQLLLEETVLPCGEIKELYPDSLGIIRVTTLLNKSKTDVTLLPAALRLGLSGDVVVDASTISANVDLKSGVVTRVATNYKGETFENHPVTNKRIVGVKLPAWDEVVELCRSAAMSYKDAALIGWDVAISCSENGEYVVQIIEGNENPCIRLIQIACGYGLAKEIKTFWES